jgi:hypothetical protein
VPGIELLGPHRRTYDKTFIQRITIDRGPKNILLLAIDLAYAPGQRAGFVVGRTYFKKREICVTYPREAMELIKLLSKGVSNYP